MQDEQFHDRTEVRRSAQEGSSSGLILRRARRQHDRASMPQVSDTTLVRQALAGEQSAFELLVQRYQPSLNRLISSYIRGYHDASDILQQVLLQLYLSLATLHSVTSIYPWLYRVTCNECLDHLRRKQPISLSGLLWEGEEGDLTPLLSLPDAEMLPEELAERHEIQLHLRAAIVALPARYRSVVYLRSIAGWSFREIAKKLDIPETTAKTRYHRAKRLLRAALSLEAGS